MIFIETERLVLRTPCVSDLGDFFAYRFEENLSDDDVSSPPLEETAAVTLLLSQQNRSLNEPGWLMLVLEDPRTGSVIGEVGGYRPAGQMHRANIGWWLHHAHRGGGLATEAVTAFIHFGFERLDLELVDATCLERNDRSHALMERLGMRREPGSVREINGTSYDERNYSLSRSDWIRRSCSQLVFKG